MHGEGCILRGRREFAGHAAIFRQRDVHEMTGGQLAPSWRSEHVYGMSVHRTATNQVPQHGREAVVTFNAQMEGRVSVRDFRLWPSGELGEVEEERGLYPELEIVLSECRLRSQRPQNDEHSSAEGGTKHSKTP